MSHQRRGGRTFQSYPKLHSPNNLSKVRVRNCVAVKKAMYPKRILYPLKYFSLWGFHCVPSIRIGGHIASLSVQAYHFGMSVWFTVSFIRAFHYLNHLMEFLDAINITFYNITAVLTYWLILCDSITKMKFETKFWHNFSRIYMKYHLISTIKWKFPAAIILLLIGHILCYSYAMFFDGTSRNSDTVLHFLFQLMIDSRVIFYVFHVELIACQLRKVSSELLEMRHQNGQNAVENIKRIRILIQLTFEMIELVNTIFGWSQLALVFLSFESTVTLMNSIYRQIHGKLDQFHGGTMTISSTIIAYRIIFHLFCINKYTADCYTVVN